MWKHVVKNKIVNERKWELKTNDVVLGTIYHKAPGKGPDADKFSLYVSSPFIYRELPSMGETHTFNTLEEAQQGFDDLCREKALLWCREMTKYFEKEA